MHPDHVEMNYEILKKWILKRCDPWRVEYRPDISPSPSYPYVILGVTDDIRMDRCTSTEADALIYLFESYEEHS